jgi:hypothetical protein
MTVHYLGDPKFRAFDSNGEPLSGGLLDTYEEGSSTPKASFSDGTGLVVNPNPVVLDAAGRTEVWLDGKYKLRLRDSAGAVQWTMDSVAGVGFVAAAEIIDEWTPFTDSTPSFVDATNFSVAADKRATFQVGRRVRATVLAGTIYGRITVSVFTTLTTVTVLWDAGVLDSGLSAIAVGFLSVTNKSTNWRAIDGLELDFSKKGLNDSFVAGTRMLFNQTVAPVGWTKIIENDKALRLTTGSVGTGGTIPFLTVFGTGLETGGHQLTIAEMPSHDHPTTELPHSNVNIPTAANPRQLGFPGSSPRTGFTGGDGTHTHPLALELQYVDVILAEKD